MLSHYQSIDWDGFTIFGMPAILVAYYAILAYSTLSLCQYGQTTAKLA